MVCMSLIFAVETKVQIRNRRDSPYRRNGDYLPIYLWKAGVCEYKLLYAVTYNELLLRPQLPKSAEFTHFHFSACAFLHDFFNMQPSCIVITLATIKK